MKIYTPNIFLAGVGFFIFAGVFGSEPTEQETAASIHQGITLVDNGYEGLVVSIDERLPDSWCQNIMNGIEVVLARASSVLYHATRRRAYFRNITVILPPHWSATRCPQRINSSAVPHTHPTITVASPHPVYGHAPWTLQVGGCGQAGRTIYMSPQFLADKDFADTLGDPGRILVQEWAKYRYGVFEEYGHPNDTIYPAFHRSVTQLNTPTGCSNTPVHGTTASCVKNETSSCRFAASVTDNDDVTSSLMFLHHLPHVTQFCDAMTHQIASPNKQNSMCHHKSVWEVILAHEDFANGSNPAGELTRETTPTITYVRPSHPRFVIVVEDTAVMNVQKRWDFLRKAVRKFMVYDLPTGSDVGVVLFDRTAHSKLPLSKVPHSLDDRGPIATASMPRNPTMVAQSQKCIICGLEEAVRMLEEKGHSSAGGVILLVTAGSPLPLTPYDIKQMGRVVTKKGVRIVPIIYPVTDRNPKPSPGVEKLAQLSGTQSLAVIDEGIGSDSKVSMMISLMDAFYAALRLFIPSAKDLPVVIHKQGFPGGIISISQGSFLVDESLGGEVKFGLTYYDLGHVGNMVNLIDPNGRVVETLKLQEEDGDVNTIFVTVKNAMPGKWRYRVENRADSHQSLYMRVWATPRQLNATPDQSPGHSTLMDHSTVHSTLMAQSTLSDNAISLEAWTSNQNSTIDPSDGGNFVVVYAKVFWGSSPVIGATVAASLQRLGVNSTGSPYPPIIFTLFDNGNGDSDITKNDGIYSRYLPPSASAPAKYTLSVTLSDEHGAAKIVLPAHRVQSTVRTAGFRRASQVPFSVQGEVRTDNEHRRSYEPAWPRCCGSVLPYQNSRPTGPLFRTATVGLLDISGRTKSAPVPPSRIGDFRAEVNPARQTVRFFWTAPGDKLDHGQAMRYEVQYTRSIVQSPQSVASETGPDWTAPARVGQPSSHAIRWWRHDYGIYYVKIRAINRGNVSGAWSNAAIVFMPEPQTTTENIATYPANGDVAEAAGAGSATPRPASLSTRNILVIVGAACGILVLILIMSVYYLVVVSRRRRQKAEKQAIEIPEATTTAACDTDSDTDSISKPPPNEPPKRTMSPIQSWPASTLLAEHEKRRPNEELGLGPMGLAQPQPDIGAPQCFPGAPPPIPPHPFYYHTPNGHYIEDSLAMDTGSVISTGPSDSLLMFRDPEVSQGPLGVSHTSYDHPHLPSSGVPSTAPTPVSWEGSRRPKVPPPTPPKPTLTHLSGADQRKRRNVTQV